MIYVSHPFGGKSSNKRKVERIIKKLLTRSLRAVYVSPIHAFGYFYKQVDYDRGMQCCLDLLSKCNLCLFCYGWESSPGCKRELEYCIEHRITHMMLNRNSDVVRTVIYK